MPLKLAQLQQLKTEIATDPMGLGLTALLASGAVSEVTGRLNAIWPAPQAWNPAAPANQFLVNEDAADTDAMVAAMHPTDWAALTVDQRDFFRLITTAATLKVQTFHRTWADTLPDGTGAGQNSRKRVKDLLTRDGSRAEKLFGSGTQLTDDDVVAARNLP